MSEFLSNQETKGDTQNGFTVLMGLKERKKETTKKRNQGSLTRQGGGGTSSPFSVPSTSPMISAEYRRSVASQATRCHLRLEPGCTGVTIKGSGGGAAEFKFSN